MTEKNSNTEPMKSYIEQVNYLGNHSADILYQLEAIVKAIKEKADKTLIFADLPRRESI